MKGDIDNLRQQITDLQNQIDQQANKIAELEKELDRMKNEIKIDFNLAFGTMDFGGSYYDSHIWQELIDKLYSENYCEEELRELYEKIMIVDLPIKVLATSFSEWSSVNATLSKLNAKRSESELLKLEAKYDESFFVDNVLIVYVSRMGSMGSTLNKVQVVRHENELVVRVFATKGYMDASTDWAIFLEVKKDNMQSVTSLRVEEFF